MLNNKADPDHDRISRIGEAGDKRPSLGRFARNPGRSDGVERLDQVAAARDVDDHLAGKDFAGSSSRITPKTALIRTGQETESPDPGRKAPDLRSPAAFKWAQIIPWIVRRRPARFRQCRPDQRASFVGRQRRRPFCLIFLFQFFAFPHRSPFAGLWTTRFPCLV